MRSFKNFNEVNEYTENQKLPVGAYKVKIIRAEEQEDQNNSCALCILFDIAEGEYKDFYMNKFHSDKKAYPDEAKFKGVFKLWYPNGGKYDKNTERKMKTALMKIKESNNLNIDFTKEWDGASLKNCTFGMVFREQEYSYKGYSGMTVQPYSAITLEELKEGRFTIPAPKYLNESSQKSVSSIDDFTETESSVDDLPF